LTKLKQKIKTNLNYYYSKFSSFFLLLHVDDSLHERIFLLGLSKLPTERFEGDETVFVFLGAGFLKDGDDFFLLHALTQGDEDVLQLSVEHGVVALLVVELQDFHEVLEGAAVLILLHLGVNRKELIELHHLGLLHLLLAELLTDGNGGVEVEGSQTVSQVEGIHCVVTLEVVDREGKLRLLNIASTEVGHGA